jgi:hypothetical protein
MMIISQTQRVIGAIALVIMVTAATSASACDDLADRLLSSYLGPAIQALGCSELGKAGVDVAEHKLESVCYTSSGSTSSVEIVASLSCHTSSAAVIKGSVSERVIADAQVRGADCNVQDIKVRPSGEIGKILIGAFGVNGRAHAALQDGLSRICSR